MPIEQVAFVIPAPIEAGLAAGELVRHGGIVRNGAGHIVMHLKEVPTSTLDKAIVSTRQLAKINKPTLIVGTAAVVVLGGTALAFSAVKQKKIEKAEKQLQAALSAYFKAIAAQDMNLTVINELDRSLEELRALKGKPTNELVDGDDLDSLICYSQKFILHNTPTQLGEAETTQPECFEDYLAEQKRIFAQTG